MIKILMVCHGNICRSPMAEFIFKKLTADDGLSNAFEIASAATSAEELGNDIYPPARRVLTANGIPVQHRAARQITNSDLSHFDYIVVMDESNLRWLRRMFSAIPEKKIFKLMSFADQTGDVSDPWYTGNFEQAYCDIFAGCTGLLRRLTEQR